jgi:hypothetical protein
MAEPKNFFGRDGRAAHSNGTYDVAKYLVLLFAALSAMLDRLLHHGHVLKCGPRSWRTKTGSPGESQ